MHREHIVIVVVGGVKGGSGKTTVATNLAVIRSLKRKKVLLVDADEQKSASQFAAQRDGFGIETRWSTIQLGGRELHAQVNRLKPDFDDIIIDVGGRATTSQRSALLIADLFVMPFNPASYDIWTVSEVNMIIQEMRTVNVTLKAIAFINRADPAGTDNQESIEILRECKEFECLDITLGNRKAFRTSAGEGISVIEMKTQEAKKAAEEMLSLYEYIYQISID
jgi:chromosome partitioning protein